MMPPEIDPGKCNFCGVCVDICPQDVLAIEDGKLPTVEYPYECWHCGACYTDCPTQAIKLVLPLTLRFRGVPVGEVRKGDSQGKS